MPLCLTDIDKEKVGPFSFKELNGQYLLTNDIGDHIFLIRPFFEAFLSGNITQIPPDKLSELRTKGFVRNCLNFDSLSQKYALKNRFLGQGTGLHIIVVTLRCDHKCLYCQAGSKGLNSAGYDMDISTAEKTVDMIFESPSKNISIEFQGGEPLLNWDTIKFIIEYSREKNKSAKKILSISLVSNLTFMSEDKLKFLIEKNIGICTSLDGPETLHNRNRICGVRKNSYKNTIKWIKRIKQEIQKNSKYKFRINALVTVNKFSLTRHKAIIKEYINLKLDGIYLRPINPFGINKIIWKRISFSTEEFMDFYRKSLDYIIGLNLKGEKFHERTAEIFLSKILTNEDPNFLDIRSPCGAGIGQIAYNFNGNIYTCDEGRMFSMMGDESFRIGNVAKNNYEEIINNDVVKTLCLASCLDNVPRCSDCVYKPYCGACPIYNYATQGDLFSKPDKDSRCKIYSGILEYLFDKLQTPARRVLESWVIKERK